jgi:HD-GYP domain-containing protein (c-di-GMP phosphodiesterase class II)
MVARTDATMANPLKLYIAGLVATSAVALVATSLLYGIGRGVALDIDGVAGWSALDHIAGVVFWVVVALFASALPVRMPGGILVTVSIAPLVASINLGGPAVGAWVALIGTTELRELRGRIPWYGTLANHAGIVIPAAVGGVVLTALKGSGANLVQDCLATMVGATVYFALNLVLATGLIALRTGQSFRTLLLSDTRAFRSNLLGLAPLAWLMAEAYSLAAWAALLFALPLYTTRLAYQKFVEMRDMFTQTIGALAEAVDKRDPFTSKHSHRVSGIAVDIGREMGVNENELEALQWGGLLHDVGKIGVPDAVLLKQEKLSREERVLMNAHPVKGAEIIMPVTRLAAELPIIRHHHEWYNGSGYPDRLIGDEIPRLARILHVADAFEAMTAARPYRMTPLTPEQALAELRKFAGVQFDPAVVDAFVKTPWASDIRDAARGAEPRPIPLLAQAAARMTQATAADGQTATQGESA